MKSLKHISTSAHQHISKSANQKLRKFLKLGICTLAFLIYNSVLNASELKIINANLSEFNAHEKPIILPCAQSVTYTQEFGFVCENGNDVSFFASGYCVGSGNSCSEALTNASNCAIENAITSAEQRKSQLCTQE